jgi:uncharacterized protein (TIRG00374 family)
MNKKSLLALRITLGILLIVLIYFKIGIKETIKALISMNLLFWIPILITLFLSFIVAAWNIKILSDKIVKIPLKKIYHYYLLSWSLGLLAPGKIGEFSIAYFLKKHNITFGEGFAIALLEKMIIVFCLAIVSGFGFFIFFDFYTAIYLSIFTAIVFLAAVLVVSSKKIRELIRRYILRKYEIHFKGFFKLMKEIMKDKKLIAINILLAILKWTLSSAVMWLIFISLSAKVNFIHVFVISAITIIISLIPLTPSGIGTKEGAAIYLY